MKPSPCATVFFRLCDSDHAGQRCIGHVTRVVVGAQHRRTARPRDIVIDASGTPRSPHVVHDEGCGQCTWTSRSTPTHPLAFLAARALTKHPREAGRGVCHPPASSCSNPGESEHWRGFASRVPPLSTTLSHLPVESRASFPACGQVRVRRFRRCGKPQGKVILSTTPRHCRAATAPPASTNGRPAYTAGLPRRRL